MSNTSILDIRKISFIEDPNQENSIKLIEKIDSHKEIFDNKFFAKATEKAILKNNVKGLLFISNLYVLLNRNIEAEYILRRAYEIDNTNNEILYYLFDILCRRKQFGLVSSISEKLDKSKDELMYVKSLIKYFLLCNKEKELNELLQHYFEKYNGDKELVRLIFIAAIQNNNHYFTYMVSKTKFRQDLFSGLSGPVKSRIKNHFYIMINNLLKEKIHDIKGC